MALWMYVVLAYGALGDKIADWDDVTHKILKYLIKFNKKQSWTFPTAQWGRQQSWRSYGQPTIEGHWSQKTGFKALRIGWR